MMRPSCLVLALAATSLTATAAQARIVLKISYVNDFTFAGGTVSLPGSMEFDIDGKEVSVYQTGFGGRTFVTNRSAGRGNLFGPSKSGFALEP